MKAYKEVGMVRNVKKEESRDVGLDNEFQHHTLIRKEQL
jgi:hypothetical protein